MRISYDPEADAAYIYLTDEPLAPGRDSIPCDPPEGMRAFVVLDWKDGKIAGLEVLDARALLHADLLAQARPLVTKAERLMGQFAVNHPGEIIHRGSDTFIAADAIPRLVDQAQHKGLKVLGLEGFLVDSENVYPALSRIADFSGDSPATSAARAQELLQGPWAEPPTAADQMHPKATGRYMLTVVLGELRNLACVTHQTRTIRRTSRGPGRASLPSYQDVKTGNLPQII